VHKVTIVPRGRALGVTQQLPDEDRYTMTRNYAINRIAVMMGGRAAEEVVFGEITSGAGNDIQVATNLARKMVCEWGMSDVIGPLRYAGGDTNPFLSGGMGNGGGAPYSEDVAQKIDAELNRIISSQYQAAIDLLEQNRHLLDLMSEALLEFEVLDAEELKIMLEDENLDRIREKREASQKEEEDRRERDRTPKTDFSSKLKDQLSDLTTGQPPLASDPSA
jgi:cell division protease FtsH